MSCIVKNIPNFLTILRILLVPVLVISFYIDTKFSNYLNISIFAFASITDYFDGLLARKLDAHTHFGRLLDPIADKILVISMLIMLVARMHVSAIPIVIIVSRELFVSGLREYLARLECPLPVTLLSKIKTMLQMIAIIIVMLDVHISAFDYQINIGEVMLYIVAILTLLSGYGYCRIAFQQIENNDRHSKDSKLNNKSHNESNDEKNNELK